MLAKDQIKSIVREIDRSADERGVRKGRCPDHDPVRTGLEARVDGCDASESAGDLKSGRCRKADDGPTDGGNLLGLAATALPRAVEVDDV